ncbi:MAG: helicase, partial [Hyphomicrobiales bacterium]
RQIEDHEFQPVKVAQWRNRRLDFTTMDELLRSLNAPPRQEGLTRALAGDDVQALEFLMHDPQIRSLTEDEEAVQLFWDVCQIPDYRNITGAEHALIVSQVFRHLRSASGLIPSDWFARQMSYADRTDGDIDTLANRIAHIRTWTFLSNRNDWLEDAAGWQQRAMEIENKLSDALHERLAQRFIDRRTSVLMKRLREKDQLMAAVSPDGDIHVEGEFVGQLKGFRFQPDESTGDAHAKTLKTASLKAIAAEISTRATACANAPDDEFAIVHGGIVEWKTAPVARLEGGSDVLRPKLVLLANDQLTGTERDLVQTRLEGFVENHIATVLEPLVALSKAENLEGMARGLGFQLTESLGLLNRDDVADEVKGLDQTARGSLRKYGVRFGAFHIFMPALLKPAVAEMKLMLWALWNTKEGGPALDALPKPPGQGLTSTVFDKSTPKGFYQAVGYRICGNRVVRVDMLERLADVIRPRIFWKPAEGKSERPEGSVEGGGFTVIAEMMSLVGCSGEDMAMILRALGYKMDRRKIKPAPPETETVAKPEAPAASESEAEAKPEEEAKPDAGADAPSPDAAGKPEGEAAEADAASIPEEPQYIEVWRPAGRARKPNRRPAGAKQNRDGAKQGRKQARGKRDGKPNKHGRGKGKDGVPAKKPAMKPEDSPFAALGALKKQLDAADQKKDAAG